jgi:3',5'-cyclic AMP phosphodiesterase CpdA
VLKRRTRAALLATAAALTLPAAAQAAQPLSLVDDREALGPGVELTHEHYLTAAGWVDRHVLTANLADPAVTSDLLHADEVAQGSALSTQANAAGAVAGVNGDFFDIGNSGASLGFEFVDGRLRKSGTRNNGQSVGVTQSGIGRLANLALAARATFGFQDHPIAGYNQVGIPADGIGAYTSEWGRYDRATQVGGAADPAEVWVANGEVTRAAQPPAAGTLPEGTTALVGREAGAAALRTLAVGDDVALSYAVNPALQDRFRFALGTDVQLVRDGAAVPDSESGGGAAGNSVAPRTAIGFKNEGRTMILLTVDGPGGTGRGGVTLPQLAHMLDDLGAELAVNLDGGGSTTMVARPLGNPLATLRNVPSDGSERSDPNGVGVFVAPGNGAVEDLVIGGVPKVFPGLHRTLSVAAIDDHKTPAELDRAAVGWTAEAGSVAGGLFKAPEQGDRTVRVRATTATARADEQVRVLGRLRSLELSTRRLSIPEPTSAPTILTVTGRDGQGYTAPVEAADLELEYDPAVVRIQPAGDALKITPVAQGGTLITIGAGDQSVKLPTTVGVNTTTIYEFDNADEHQRWITNGTSGTEKILSIAPEGLRLDYKKARNMGVTKFPDATRIDVPGQPLRVHWRVWSDGPTEYSNMTWIDAEGVSKSQLIGGVRDGWNDVFWTLPSDTKFPIKLASFQVIETNTARQRDGAIVLDRIDIDSAPDVELPPEEPLRADPLIAPGGRTNGEEDWTYATLSDIQFTAADPTLAKVGIAALKRIRRERPDLVVLNGDITDLGAPADLELARATLEAGGCDLIRAGDELPEDHTPPANGPTVPCYYVPGNHEAYTAGGQGTLDAWKAEFGEAYRTFDHKGTRFVLLNSALGSLRGSDFPQLALLEQALESARTDDEIDNVLVFAHHPVDDPAETKASQLTDRVEVRLIKKLLSDFRADSGKGVTMTGSHAQILNVHREEGVPYTVLPSSGKAPYGTPDRGGITGWVKWSVDSDARASDQWLTADARPFASTIELNTPASVEVGTSATLSGSILQPSGVDQNGTRRVPLAYPMSVHWGGSDSLAIGSGEDAVDAARKAGKVAILDPATRALTGLRTGNLKVSVTVDSMREYTGEASLAPIRTERVIDVRAYTGPGPRFSAPVPVFPAQPTGTISPAQSVVVTNEGDRPLEIAGVRIVPGDAGSEGEFLLVGDDCSGAQVAPGATCTALVRFAPSRPDATFSAALEFDTNTAERVNSVALSGTSTALPSGEDGADGIAGAAAPLAPVPAGKRSQSAAAPPAPVPAGERSRSARRGAPVVSVRCRLVDGRRGVRCTVSTTSRSRLKATVRVGSRSRAASRAGKVTVTVKTGRRLTRRSRVRVRAAVGGAAAVVSVKPGRSARATLTR